MFWQVINIFICSKKDIKKLYNKFLYINLKSLIIFHSYLGLVMNINDKYVLEMLNKFIAIDRLNKSQILKMVNLVSISNDINDLKDNLNWENTK